ncbi:biotin/lipoyl-binding protein [Pseudoalteromonas rhizosphaerae]|uniref:Biotin/lipoyl-binding protein n=1 Tax=Pseudoalteromonas rhizosphaerae TaxID=2518973 RepID=A0ABW8KRS3_9GAMM
MVRYLRIMLTIVVIIAAIFAGRWVWTDYMDTPWTRDGRIRADIVTIVPDVSGWVTKLNVKDGQQVAKGELLFSVDQQRYQAAYDKSKANTNNSLYSWELAKHKYERRKA